MASRWRFAALLRFMSLGLALWLGKLYIEQRDFFVIETPSNASLEIDYQDWARRTGHFPDDAQRDQIFHTELEDRVLFKEAIRRELYLDDPVVYQRLLKDAEFIGIEGSENEVFKTALDLQLQMNDEIIRRYLIEKLKTLVRTQTHPVRNPSDGLLRSRYLSAQDRWKVAPNIEIEHVFFSADRADSAARVEAAGRALNARSLSGENAYSLGDKFLFGNRLPQMSLTKIKDTFGEQFADALQNALSLGKIEAGSAAWYGPIKSPYGSHFVKVISYRESTYEDFQQAKAVLVDDYNKELQDKALENYLSRLFREYEVKNS